MKMPSNSAVTCPSLSARLSGSVHVELAMSYGDPSIPDALDRLHANHVRRLVVLPLSLRQDETCSAEVRPALPRFFPQAAPEQPPHGGRSAVR